MRRLHWGHENVLKRLLIQVSAFNLGNASEPGCGNAAGSAGADLRPDATDFVKRLKGLFGLIPAAWPEKPNSATPSLLPPVGTT